MDFNELNDIVKEFLRFNGYERTAEAMEAEERARLAKKATRRVLNHVPKDKAAMEKFPRLYRFYEKDFVKTAKEERLEAELKELTKKQSTAMQSGRQIFSIAINCLQQLHNIKDIVAERGQSGAGNSMTDNLGETIENYKIQLGRYNKFLFSEGSSERSELFIEAVMSVHKGKLIKAKE